MSDTPAFSLVASDNATTATLYEAPRTADGAWSGYFLPSVAGDPPVSIGFANSLTAYGGSYLFGSTRPAELDSAPAAFIQGVLAYINQQSPVSRLIVWLKAVDPVIFGNLSAYGMAFGGTPDKYSTNSNWNAALGKDFIFFIVSTTQILIDEVNGMLKFQASSTSASPKIGFNRSGSNLGINLTGDATLIYAWIPFIGNNTGCVTFNAQLQSLQSFNPATSPPGLPTGFAYTANTGDKPQTFFYPAFNVQQLPALLTCSASFDPLDPFNQLMPQSALLRGVVRSGFFPFGSPALPSAFRNELGNQISLLPIGAGPAAAGVLPQIPLQAGALAFSSADAVPANPVTAIPGLSPAGQFGISVAQLAAGQKAQLLCGIFGSERLGFTSWNPASSKNDVLQFVLQSAAYAPIFPFTTATLNVPDSGQVQVPLNKQRYSAWASIVAGGDTTPYYQAEPAGSPMYALGSGEKNDDYTVLESSPIPLPLPQGPTNAFPLVPYGSFGSSPTSGISVDTVASFESTILAATRKSTISAAATAAWQRRADVRLARNLTKLSGVQQTVSYRTTPQGAIAEVDAASGAMLSITLGQTVASNGTTLPFGFVAPTEALQDALQTNQLFLVAVNAQNLCTDSADFKRQVEIAGWKMSAQVGNGVSATSYKNVMVLKYCDGTFKSRVQNPNNWSGQADFSLPAGTSAGSSGIAYTGLSQWLQNLIKDAELQVANNPASPYANFVTLINDTNWKGVLVLQADLDVGSLPDGLKGIVAGIDLSRFVAHHFGFTATKVNVDDSGVIGFDGNSSTFGLIDYIDPTYAANLAAGLSGDTPVTLSGSANYAFSVLQLQVLFNNAVIETFQSHIELAVNTLFQSPVLTTTFNGATMAANGVVLDGSYIDQNGTGIYVFEQSQPSIFSLNSNLLSAVAFNRVQFNYLGTIDGGVTALNRFMVWGNFNFADLKSKTDSIVFDVLSFGSVDSGNAGALASGDGLSFSSFVIDMTYPVATPGSVTFVEDTGNLAYDLSSSAVREESLFKGFGLQLSSFIAAKDGERPADYGFLTVAADLNLSALSGPWYGVTYNVTMGGPGALASAAGFTSTLLLAWAPTSSATDSSYALFIGLSLPGAAPGAKLISLQGVFKVSVDSIALMRQTVNNGADKPTYYYSMRLDNIGVRILGIAKLPPNASIQFFLFGDPGSTGSLGWYAAYRDESEKNAASELDADAKLLVIPAAE